MSVSSGFRWADARQTSAHRYLWPAVQKVLRRVSPPHDRRVFDLGCGNGATAAWLDSLGYQVTGIDPSASGIAAANQSFPHLRLQQRSTYDDLPREYGSFPVVVSLEVVEHVYEPRSFAQRLYSLVQPGGTAVVSTPYHGYWKNLALAVTGKMDAHFTALWDYGHIKFWSIKTLSALLEEAGFRRLSLLRVGRIPPLARSMIVVARRPD